MSENAKWCRNGSAVGCSRNCVDAVHSRWHSRRRLSSWCPFARMSANARESPGKMPWKSRCVRLRIDTASAGKLQLGLCSER